MICDLPIKLVQLRDESEPASSRYFWSRMGARMGVPTAIRPPTTTTESGSSSSLRQTSMTTDDARNGIPYRFLFRMRAVWTLWFNRGTDGGSTPDATTSRRRRRRRRRTGTGTSQERENRSLPERKPNHNTRRRIEAAATTHDDSNVDKLTSLFFL